MRVRLLTDVSDEVRSYASGEVVDLAEATAERWIAAGMAEPEGGPVAGKKSAKLEAAALADAEKRG